MFSLQLVHITTTQSIRNGSNRFVTGSATSKKSMIPIGLNAQNQVVLLSGNKP